MTLLAVACLALLPLLHAQPVDDDFNRAIVPRGGWVAFVIRYTYMQWSGRWAGVGLSAFVLPRVDPTRWYPVLLFALHAAQLAALACFWRLLYGPRLRRRILLPLTLGAYAFLWALCPAPGETYYWFSGGVEYYLSLSLGVMLVAALTAGARRLGEGNRRGWLWVLPACPAAFAVAGMHEMTGAALCVALAAGLLAACLARRAVLPAALVFVCGGAGCLVCVLAPGNAVRGATFQNGHHLLYTVRGAGRLVVFEVIPWLLHPALWAATLGVLLTPPGARRPVWLRGGAVPWHWLLPAVTVAMVSIWILVPCWVMGGSNGRALCATQECLLLGWFASVVAWGARSGWLRGVRGARRRRLRRVAWGVLTAALLLSGNPRHVAEAELDGTARSWSRQTARQREQAHAARLAGRREAVVDRLATARPPFFYSDGITPDPADWRNQSFATYFRLSKVRTGADKKK